MEYRYAYQGKENVAKAVSKDLAVSTKSAIMLANFVRGKTVQRARRDLQDVLKYSQAVPFTRFTDGAGHKPGMGPGKYPQKASQFLLTLVNSVAANAQDRGLGDDLTIVHCCVHQGARSPKGSRHRGRLNKSTHIEIAVMETPGTDERKPARKPSAGTKPKSAVKEESKVDLDKGVKAPAKKESKPQQEREEPEPAPRPASPKGTPAPTAAETKGQGDIAGSETEKGGRGR